MAKEKFENNKKKKKKKKKKVVFWQRKNLKLRQKKRSDVIISITGLMLKSLLRSKDLCEVNSFYKFF